MFSIRRAGAGGPMRGTTRLAVSDCLGQQPVEIVAHAFSKASRRPSAISTVPAPYWIQRLARSLVASQRHA